MSASPKCCCSSLARLQFTAALVALLLIAKVTGVTQDSRIPAAAGIYGPPKECVAADTAYDEELVSFRPGSPEAEADRQAMVDCINAHQPPIPAASQDASLAQYELSAVRVAGAWWSERQRGRVPITVATMLSLSRLSQLLAMCRAWHGPLSAVVWLPLRPDSADAASSHSDLLGDGAQPEHLVTRITSLLAALHREVDAGSWLQRHGGAACQLDLMLAVDPIADGSDPSTLFPINVLRNYAGLQARTPYVAWLDVDTIPSASLYDAACAGDARWARVASLLAGNTSAGNPAQQQKPPVPARAYVVLPALALMPPFPLQPGQRALSLEEQMEVADAMVRRGKAEVAEAKHGHQVKLFSRRTSTQHGPTDYGHWLRLLDPWHDAPYAVDYRYGFEAWGIVNRRASPFSDARFRGYGFDKWSYLAYLNATGTRFWVHPEAFVLHRPHARTTARAWFQRPFTEAPGSHPEVPAAGKTWWHLSISLLDRCYKGMHNGSYTPVVDPASAVCSRTLRWWR